MVHNSDERRREQDDFWDISELMPKRTRRDSVRSPGATDAVEIEVAAPQDGGVKQASATDGKGTPSEEFRLHRAASSVSNARSDVSTSTGNGQEPVDDYTPSHPLIHRVRVYDIPSEYNYYEQFLSHAERICGLRGQPCRPVSFFSYVPEYSQLTKPQLDWYLWWREQVWQGEYPEVDYSYIMLYANELINTGGHSSPAWGQKQLCELWRAYHPVYSRLNWLMAEWICDFSLIWHLPAPMMPQELVASSSLREFYMVAGGKRGDEQKGIPCDALITYCSNYDYKTSKFARGDVRKLYDEHIPAAIEAAFSGFYDDNGKLTVLANMNDCSRVRVAYTGALCTYKCRKKIAVDYCSFAHTYELRMVVTDAVKYVEIRLRTYLGIKSRVGARQVRPEIKLGIDAYFDRVLPQRKRSSQQPQRQEYERLYDVSATGLSLEAAERIEKESWKTTERLLEAFGDAGTAETADGTIMGTSDAPDGTIMGMSDAPDVADTTDMTATTDSAVAALPDTVANNSADNGAGSNVNNDVGSDVGYDTENVTTPRGGLPEALGEYMEFVRLVDCHDTAGQREFAQRRGDMTDLIMDKINEISVDYFGDVILFESDNGLEIVDEYRGELFYE